MTVGVEDHYTVPHVEACSTQQGRTMNDPTITGQRSLPLLSELDREMIVDAATRCEELLRIADRAEQDVDVHACCRRRASGEAMFALAVAEGRA